MTGTHTGSRSDALGTSTDDSSVKDQAKSAVGTAASKVREGSSDLTHVASERAGEVAHKAADKADERKAELAQQVRTLQEKAAEFATSITEEQPQLGHALERVTDKADGLVSWIEDTPVEEMAQSLRVQMRRHPALFAAGMFGIGFALSRVLKPIDGVGSSSGPRELTTTSSASTGTGATTGMPMPAHSQSGVTTPLPAASSVDGGMH